jgi:hypothetical protein
MRIMDERERVLPHSLESVFDLSILFPSVIKSITPSLKNVFATQMNVKQLSVSLDFFSSFDFTELWINSCSLLMILRLF